ncbi:hypothetical protein C7S17_0209 [Burkholderia thailandensis]|nr:hypothetical protein [Burkholderia thailandensis]
MFACADAILRHYAGIPSAISSRNSPRTVGHAGRLVSSIRQAYDF